MGVQQKDKRDPKTICRWNDGRTKERSEKRSLDLLDFGPKKVTRDWVGKGPCV